MLGQKILKNWAKGVNLKVVKTFTNNGSKEQRWHVVFKAETRRVAREIFCVLGIAKEMSMSFEHGTDCFEVEAVSFLSFSAPKVEFTSISLQLFIK